MKNITLEQRDIRLKRDSFLPLLFAIALILIFMVLRHLKPGYNLGNDKVIVNYLQFMDGLKLYRKNRDQFRNLREFF